MSKIGNMTVDELMELGYDVRLSRYGFNTDGDAIEEFRKVLDEGANVVKEVPTGSRGWVTYDYAGLTVTHFMRVRTMPTMDSVSTFLI